ncbi:MAG TPA: PIG-L family deacetylase [Pyrinomonadaceae bacterium]|nr:PIG-L family deacetylase [Pyrinomonadaceae bacterium]
MQNIRRRPLDSVFVIPALFLVSVLALQTLHFARAQEVSPAPGAAAQSINKADLHQALLDLTNVFTVMCVAAHPDDEDGTTLTVLRRKHGVNTVSLFTTFGEGGQNAVGPELYEELGLIRTEETIKASQIQGSQPFFLGMKDFGFSKSADEAFQFWNHDEALRRMVLKIRELRPDVIITNHDTTSGHGHHQATGRLLLEAFDAAADPKRFPEQLAQIKPWQVQRLFVRGFGGTRPPAEGQSPAEKTFAIDPNEVDPVRGTSFAEQALAALQQHASQGPWPKSIPDLLKARRIDGGTLPFIRYRLVREAPTAPPLPPDADTPVDGLELPAVVAAALAPPKIENKPLADFLDHPDRILAALVDWRAMSGRTFTQTLDGLADGSGLEATVEDAARLHLFSVRADRALGVAAGVSLTLSSPARAFVPGVSSTFAVAITNGSVRTVQVNALRFKSWGEEVPLKIADQMLPDTEATATIDRVTPRTTKFTVPRAEHLYDGGLFGNRVAASAELEIDGAKFSLHTDLTRDVAPAVEIRSISPSPYVWTPATRNQPLAFKVTLVNHLDAPFRGNLTIGSRRQRRFESGSKLSLGPLEKKEVTLKSNAMPLHARIPRRRGEGTTNEHLTISVESETLAQTIAERPVTMVYSEAVVPRNLRVGYFASFDDSLEKSLAALGVSAKRLTIEDAQKGDLNSYQTIIVDNRGYEAHPELIAANSRLLEFVNAGGTLIVLYHKDNEWNPDPKKNRPQLAPHPIVLGGERVTVETAPIKFSQPAHSLLNYPNRIATTDFNDWIQERGLYYPKTWDGKYTELFSTNDPGEKPQTGGLLAAEYGKGKYIYTSMVWYRQLRAGVPGGYRMFANMISYGHGRSK